MRQRARGQPVPYSGSTSEIADNNRLRSKRPNSPAPMPMSSKNNNCLRTLEQAERMRRLDECDHWPPFFRGLAASHLGMRAVAIDAQRQALAFSSGSPVMRAALGYCYAAAGERRQACAVLKEVEKLADMRVFSYETARASAQRWASATLHSSDSPVRVKNAPAGLPTSTSIRDATSCGTTRASTSRCAPWASRPPGARGRSRNSSGASALLGCWCRRGRLDPRTTSLAA